MAINYETFERTLKEGNYEDAFHILFRMIDNLDPNALKADKKWLRLVRKNSEDKVIQKIEKEYYELPREKKKEMEVKYLELMDLKNVKTSNI